MSRDRLIELIKSLEIAEVTHFFLQYKNFDVSVQDEREIEFKES